MGLDPRFDVSYEPTHGHPDKPYVGRFRGTWVISAASEHGANQLLFRFHNRRTNPDTYPTPAYMVRTEIGADYYPSLDLDECRQIADELGGSAHVMALREVGFEKIAARGVIYRAGGSSAEDVPSFVHYWTRVAPETLDRRLDRHAAHRHPQRPASRADHRLHRPADAGPHRRVHPHQPPR